jgi:cytochrome c-type biogenesis protein CcmH
MMARLIAGLAMTLALSMQPLAALAADAVPTEHDPVAAARAVKLSEKLRCLVCQNQSIDESDAPLARDLRLLVRERLTKGDSDDEAVDFVVSRYGDYVLLKPRVSTGTLVLWFGPFLLLAGAVLMLRRRRAQRIAPAERALSGDEQAQLDGLMKD